MPRQDGEINLLVDVLYAYVDRASKPPDGTGMAV